MVALGGNAVAPPGERATIANQFHHTRESLAPVVTLAREGWRIALVHGNGPQVGDELARHEIASADVEPLPLGILVAATAGWMGYMIQQSLQNALAHHGVRRTVVTLITQTLCDAADPALLTPTKPVGHAIPPDRLARLRAAGVPLREVAPQHWRRLAPSPQPVAVVECDTVRELMTGGHIVIACGGGGPPVRSGPHDELDGVEAVVDKDRVAAILAHAVHADVLLILTNVDAVYRGFRTSHAVALPQLSLADAEALLRSSDLGAGSMRPKIEAAAAFVRAGGERAIIAELSQGLAALHGNAGTAVTREGRS